MMDVVIGYIDNIFGEVLLDIPWFVPFFLCLFVVALYFFISMKLGNLSQKKEKEIVYYYDYIFCLLSNFEYSHPDICKQKIGLHVFQSLVSSSTNPTYIANSLSLKNKISQIESSLSSKIIPDSIWLHLDRLFKKVRIRKFFSGLLKTVLVLIIVLLVLLLVCVVLV